MGSKSKIDKRDYIILRSFCPEEEMMERVKRQSTERGNADCSSDKDLYPECIIN
jgi:hypothetical protein